MGNVIPIREVPPLLPESPAGPADFIAETYRKLAGLPHFVVRPGQEQLSRWIHDSLLAGLPLVAEAPTGTGKTVAYLVGALAASLGAPGQTMTPVVVATATKGLQAQILHTDLPKLIEAGVLHEEDAVIAKGRGNYLCIDAAETLVDDGGAADNQFDFFDQGHNDGVGVGDELGVLLEQWHGRQWDGDRDTYSGPPPRFWDQVNASSDTCVGRRCEHFNNCPYFKARSRLAFARLIIANHDLVLSDLARSVEGLEPVFPVDRYLAVFDEAHHLPDKALEAGSASVDLREVLEALARMPAFGNALFRHHGLAKLVEAKDLTASDLRPDQLVPALHGLVRELDAVPVDPDTCQARFPRAEIPEDIARATRYAADKARELNGSLDAVMNVLRNTNLADKQPALKGPLVELLALGAGQSRVLKELERALALFVSGDKGVRWIFRTDLRLEMHGCPLEGADVLRRVLWGNPRLSVAMVSATLRDFSGFDRFRVRAGLPEQTRTEVLAPIFNYRANEVVLVRMTHSPRRDERDAYRKELIATLPQFIDPREGTLVLFASWALLREAGAALRTHFGERVLVQGERSLKSLRREHEVRVRSGQGSILCGVATLAEGIDMPGELCTHVVITAIPFAVPSTPIEQELADLLQDRYFPERALPDALVRLIQMVGRLIRRETDRGRITVFDKRLYETKYGRRMLQALPPFRIRVEKDGGAERRLLAVPKPGQ